MAKSKTIEEQKQELLRLVAAQHQPAAQEKADAFRAELEALCQKHNVSGYLFTGSIDMATTAVNEKEAMATIATFSIANIPAVDRFTSISEVTLNRIFATAEHFDAIAASQVVPAQTSFTKNQAFA